MCVCTDVFVGNVISLHDLYPKLPQLFWFFLAGWVLVLCFGLLSLRTGFSLIGEGELHSTIEVADVGFTSSFNFGLAFISCILFASLTFLEMARVIIVAIFKKKDGAWILAWLAHAYYPPLPVRFFRFNTGFENININWRFSTLAITLAPLSQCLCILLAISHGSPKT